MNKMLFQLILIMLLTNVGFSQSFKYLKKEDRYIFIDAKKKKREDLKFYNVGFFTEGYCKVSDGELWGLINSNGELTEEITYDGIHCVNSEWIGKMRTKWELLVSDGGKGTEASYDSILCYSEYDNNHLLLWEGEGAYVFNVLSNDIIDSINKDQEIYEQEVFAICQEGAIMKCCEDEESAMDILKCNRDSLNSYVYSRLEQEKIKCPTEKCLAWIHFVVNIDGTIEGIKFIRRYNYEMDKKLLEIIRDQPKWIPGKQKGKNVNVVIELPVDYGKGL